MKSASLLLTTVALTWVAVAEATLLLTAGALVVGGLAALKGAALVGYAVGRHRRGRSHYHHHHHHRSGGHGHYYGHYRYSRALQTAADDGENLLLSTVGQLDPNGCILKMLCNLQTKEDIKLTLEENILVDMFANSTEVFSAKNSAFVVATQMGRKTHDSAVCDNSFPRCPLTNDQLSGLLQQTWGCQPFDFFNEEEDSDYQQGMQNSSTQQ